MGGCSTAGEGTGSDASGITWHRKGWGQAPLSSDTGQGSACQAGRLPGAGRRISQQ